MLRSSRQISIYLYCLDPLLSSALSDLVVRIYNLAFGFYLLYLASLVVELKADFGVHSNCGRFKVFIYVNACDCFILWHIFFVM